MNLLMFGWEFPPYVIGGLGRVTYCLSHALSSLGIKITMVLPINKGCNEEKIKLIPTNVSVKEIKTMLNPYMSEEEYQQILEGHDAKIYGGDLKEAIEKYTARAVEIGKKEDCDIIHCHDWMTFPAGIKLKKESGKPLIVHVHATEFDRSGGGYNLFVYKIESEGFKEADKIIAVSNYTKNKIVENYNIDENKIEVVHNAIETKIKKKRKPYSKMKIVLYLGRFSIQKGPDYFIKAAKRVLDYRNDVLFVMAGTGELLPQMIDLACALNIGDKILFTGRLSDEDVQRIYENTDIYVLSSVSEPFGLTVLEAVSNGVPTIVSKNSGVREVLKNCFEVDFWDTEEMANKILSVLRYRILEEEITKGAFSELKEISLEKQASKMIGVYNSLLRD